VEDAQPTGNRAAKDKKTTGKKARKTGGIAYFLHKPGRLLN
jgi:hypothetical protein